VIFFDNYVIMWYLVGLTCLLCDHSIQAEVCCILHFQYCNTTIFHGFAFFACIPGHFPPCVKWPLSGDDGPAPAASYGSMVLWASAAGLHHRCPGTNVGICHPQRILSDFLCLTLDGCSSGQTTQWMLAEVL